MSCFRCSLSLGMVELAFLRIWARAGLSVRMNVIVGACSSQYAEGIDDNIRLGFGMVPMKNTGRVCV